VHNQERF